MSSPRFQDTGQSLAQFADPCLVRCPQCDRRAQVRRDTPGRDGSRPRLVCPHCGYTSEKVEPAKLLDAAADPFFHRPLWLQTPCCGEILWAYNAGHLDFLESYVRATLREDFPRPGPLASGLRNGTLASRLPAWLKRAQNRDDVLHCIAKLRKLSE